MADVVFVCKTNSKGEVEWLVKGTDKKADELVKGLCERYRELTECCKTMGIITVSCAPKEP